MKAHGGGRKRLVEQHPELRDMLAGRLIQHRCHISDLALFEVARKQFGLHESQSKAVRRWISEFRKEHRIELAITINPDRAKSRLMPAFGNAAAKATEFLQYVELDGSPWDVMTLSGRRRVLAMIDIATRVGCVILAPTESTENAGRLFAKFFTTVGVPSTIITDNGSGFISRRN